MPRCLLWQRLLNNSTSAVESLGRIGSEEAQTEVERVYSHLHVPGGTTTLNAWKQRDGCARGVCCRIHSKTPATVIRRTVTEQS